MSTNYNEIFITVDDDSKINVNNLSDYSPYSYFYDETGEVYEKPKSMKVKQL